MLICKVCGNVQHEKSGLPGSGWIELVLWLCYVIPGVIYSIWRRSRHQAACVSCRCREVLDVTTPVGQLLVKQYYPDGLPAVKPPPPSALNTPMGKKTLLVLLAVLALIIVSVTRK
jgi:hypothetical protein